MSCLKIPFQFTGGRVESRQRAAMEIETGTVGAFVIQGYAAHASDRSALSVLSTTISALTSIDSDTAPTATARADIKFVVRIQHHALSFQFLETGRRHCNGIGAWRQRCQNEAAVFRVNALNVRFLFSSATLWSP
jgi:hypothetical protein